MLLNQPWGQLGGAAEGPGTGAEGGTGSCHRPGLGGHQERGSGPAGGLAQAPPVKGGDGKTWGLEPETPSKESLVGLTGSQLLSVGTWGTVASGVTPGA